MGGVSAPSFFSPRVFRAISSARRVEILKALAQRPHTPTELARRLSVSDATVRAHLDVLRASGLVERRHDGRVWAYHELSQEGRSLLHARATGPVLGVLAGVALAAWSFALLQRWRALRPPALPPGTIGMPLPPDPSLPWLLGGGLATATVAALLVGIGAWAARGAWALRRRGAPSLPERDQGRQEG